MDFIHSIFSKRHNKQTIIVFIIILSAINASALNTAQPKDINKADITSAQKKNTDLNNSTQCSDKQMIQGKVLDEDGLPLIGANVSLRDNKYLSAITDLEGKFLLIGRNIIGCEIEISYIGYDNAIIVSKADSNIIRLKESRLDLSKSTDYNTPTKTNVFGENEFIKLLSDSLPESVCRESPITLSATFKINKHGKPGSPKIVYCNCDILEKLFRELIVNSPEWTCKSHSISLKYTK